MAIDIAMLPPSPPLGYLHHTVPTHAFSMHGQGLRANYLTDKGGVYKDTFADKSDKHMLGSNRSAVPDMRTCYASGRRTFSDRRKAPLGAWKVFNAV